MRLGRCKTLADLGALAAQTETVETPSGIRIHYRYDPRPAESARATIGIGHPGAWAALSTRTRSTIPRTASRWVLDAPTYGIPFGAKFCSVFVELPDDYLVRPEAYRQFLRFRGGDQRQVFLNDFGQLVMTYPAGLAEGRHPLARSAAGEIRG